MVAFRESALEEAGYRPTLGHMDGSPVSVANDRTLTKGPQFMHLIPEARLRRLGFACALSAAMATAGVPVLAQQAEPTMAEDAEIVVATVNGLEITRLDLRLFLEELPDQVRGLPIEMMFDQIVDRLVRRKLLSASARNEGLDQDSEVMAMLAFQAERILERALVLRALETQVTDEKLRAAYDVAVADRPAEEEVWARHILLETEADAISAIEQLNGGADFAALAKERSTGPTGPNGGDLGYFKREAMVAEFAEAAFAMTPGDYSTAPVKSQFGWHVILVEDRRTAAAPDFETLRPELAETVSRSVVTDLQQQMLADAEIVKFNLDGTPRAAVEEKPVEAAPAEDQPAGSEQPTATQ